MKNWISEYLGVLIAIITVAVGNLWSYARLTVQHLAHGKRLDKLEGDLERHTESSDLHRNPDFERRLEEIRKQIIQINTKLDRLIERRN